MPKITKSYFHLSQVCSAEETHGMDAIDDMVQLSVMPIVCHIFNLKFLEMFKVNQSVGYRRPGPKSGIWMVAIIVNRQIFLAITYWHLLITIHESYSNYNLDLYHCFQVLQSCRYSGFSVSKPYSIMFSCVGLHLFLLAGIYPSIFLATLNLEDQGGVGVSVCMLKFHR